MSADLTEIKKLEVQLKLKELLKETSLINNRIDLDIMYTKVKQYIAQENILKVEYNRRLNKASETLLNTPVLVKIIYIVDVLNRGKTENDFIFDMPEKLFFRSLSYRMGDKEENIKYGKSLVGFYNNNILFNYANSLNENEKESKLVKTEHQIFKILGLINNKKYKPFFDGIEMLLFECEEIHFASYTNHLPENHFITMYFKTILFATIEKLFTYTFELETENENPKITPTTLNIFDRLKMTEREKEVFSMFMQGIEIKEIASRLNIAYTTVDKHIWKICEANNIKPGQKNLKNYALQILTK